MGLWRRRGEMPGRPIDCNLVKECSVVDVEERRFAFSLLVPEDNAVLLIGAALREKPGVWLVPGGPW